jgi:hypothetical protein
VSNFSSLLIQFPSSFDNSHHHISNLTSENVLSTVSHISPAFRPYRNLHHFQDTRRPIDEFLGAGIIQESNSQYAAPGFIVTEKDNWPGRLVIEYRAFKKITMPNASPLSHSEDLCHDLWRLYHYFSKLDLKSGYHQLGIPSADRPKTVFIVLQGHYEFPVLSMGPQNAPAGFQKIMCNILNPCREFYNVFLDDIVIFSATFAEHLRYVMLVFGILWKAKLMLNVSKCATEIKQLVVLEHMVSATSIASITDAIQAILNFRNYKPLNRLINFEVD